MLATLRVPGLRLACPVRTADGRVAVDGWFATPFVDGSHESGRWSEIIEAGRLLHAATIALPRPRCLARRRDRWAAADRVAWAEADPRPFLGVPHVARLLAAADRADADVGGPESLSMARQIIHGDLTGNVLFDRNLPPAVIDFAPYWRPAEFGSAIVVADALAFEGADDGVLGRSG